MRENSTAEAAEVQAGANNPVPPGVPAMASYFGRMDAFNPKEEEWLTYVERLEMFFVVNNVPENKKAASLLTLMGGKMHALLKSLTTEMPFKDIVEVMGRHLTPKPLIIAEQYKFHKCNQEEGQSIREFLGKLQKLAETCEFGNYRDEALRDRLVCGVNSKATRRKLLGEAELSLKKAVDIAVGMELTEKEINQFSNDKPVNRVESQECFRCGKQNHSPDKCFHKNAECHICKGKGHISPKCPEKGKGALSKEDSTKSAIQNKSKSKKMSKDAKFKKKKRNSKIKFVDTQEEVGSDSEVSSDEGKNSRSDWPMFTVSHSSRGKADAILVSLNINNIPCKLELDTGASVIVIPETMWRDQLGSVPLQESDVTLKCYSGHDIPVVGESTFHVRYNAQEADLPVIITKGSGVALIGRDWLSTLKLNWKEISQVYQHNSPKPKLENPVQQYPSLFDGELGTIKGVKAKLVVKENATPQYFKPRPVPFAVRDKVAAELGRLEKEGVLKRVDSSDWTTPIVPVLKPDGTVRICGVFKLTLNKYLQSSTKLLGKILA